MTCGLATTGPFSDHDVMPDPTCLPYRNVHG
jgi:hypothetical protein